MNVRRLYAEVTRAAKAALVPFPVPGTEETREEERLFQVFRRRAREDFQTAAKIGNQNRRR